MQPRSLSSRASYVNGEHGSGLDVRYLTVHVSNYDRADHLARHLDSHRDERAFKCSECPRGFNRRCCVSFQPRFQSLIEYCVETFCSDIKPLTPLEPPARRKLGTNRAADRAIRACDHCVLSKLKCGNARPCKRCQDRGIACNTQTLPDSRRHTSPINPDGVESLQTPESGASQQPNTDAVVSGQNPTLDDQLLASTNAQQFFDNAVTWPATSFADSTYFPSFFEHIMVGVETRRLYATRNLMLNFS